MIFRCHSCGLKIKEEGFCSTCTVSNEVEDYLREAGFGIKFCKLCNKPHKRDDMIDSWMNGLCCKHWEEKNKSGMSLDDWLEEFRNNYKKNE